MSQLLKAQLLNYSIVNISIKTEYETKSWSHFQYLPSLHLLA